MVYYIVYRKIDSSKLAFTQAKADTMSDSPMKIEMQKHADSLKQDAVIAILTIEPTVSDFPTSAFTIMSWDTTINGTPPKLGSIYTP